MPISQEFQANITPYEYIGDDPSFGSLQLTMLARSFSQLSSTNLDFLFPTQKHFERTLIVEQMIEGHGVTPPVQPGIPTGQFVEPDRLRRFSVVPQPFREDDSIDRMFINQLRRPGTINEQQPAQEWISARVQKLVNRITRVKEVFQSKMLQGGWRYIDPRTKVSIDVNANIPPHNFFSYKGWSDTVAEGGTVNIMGRSFTAATALTPAKGRNEASFFTSVDGKIGVNWLYPQADIVRGLRLLQQYLYITNKNRFDTIIMSEELLSTIMATNEYIKAFQGIPGMLVNNLPTNTVAGNAAVGMSTNPGPLYMTFGPGGTITSIAGLRIVTLDGIWRNPATNKLETYWPTHKVALVASKSMSDSSASLGFTYHCSGESPDGQPGMWMETDMQAKLPAPPGALMRIGDCFVPVPIYPYWISLLDVCEPEDLYQNIPILPDLSYGTF